jgi:signal transduction histidine kinase
MTEKLKEADRLKDEFLVNTSHEFQTPLNAIINISQSVLEGTGGQINDAQRLNLGIIHAAAGRLSTLVKDILDMEKIKRSELHLNIAPVDARVTVSVVLEVLQHLVSGKSIRLINDISDKLPPVLADENRLRQVIYNLVGNAIKFTESGTIRVNAEEVQGRIKIMVEDTGIGIPEAKWRRVFASFEQGGERISLEYGGVGLGLSICRQLVGLMNGDIYVEWSEEGKGTRIAFQLPAAEGVPVNAQLGSDYAEILQRIESSPGGRKVREEGGFTLLAVDDESSNLQVLGNLFAGKDIQVITARSGLEALSKIRADRRIDLVLLDVMMPRMSGYEVCRAIRKSFSLFELPVVMLTARNTPQDIAAGFEAGANDFIVKPFDAWEVRARVHTLLELKRSVGEALKAEMAFLQSQIKPHFLFNALNAILSVCYSDSKRAAQLIAHLGHYLRSSFDLPGTGVFVTLKDELKLVEAYVEIEKARFEERLELVCEIDETLLSALFLPLSIQPLVENAIRHGIMKKEDGGKIRLTVKAEGDDVYVEVWDNGIGIAAQKLATLLDRGGLRERRGVGLANIHRRLLNYYGEGLRVESVEGSWTCVAFRVGKSGSEAVYLTEGAG